MIVIGLLVAQLGASTGPTIEYRRLPADVVSLAAYEWHDMAPPVRVSVAAVEEGRALVSAQPPGKRVVVLFIRRDGAYLIDGPFVWPRHSAERSPAPTWRRTASGAGPPAVRAGTPPVWVSLQESESWPQCRWNVANQWECWGIPATASGVLVLSAAANVWWCTMQDSTISAWRRSQWGRLLIVTDPEGKVPLKLELQAQRPVPPPAYRSKDVRLETATLQSLAIVQLPDGLAWIAGADAPEQAWIRVHANDAAPRFLPVVDLSAGPLTVPEHIELDSVRRLNGTVVAGSQDAARATVTLFRLIDPRPQPDDRLKPRRVFAAEMTADDNGAFAFDDIGNGVYEILAWHPQFGHASVILQPAQESVRVELEQPGIARGRVVIGGKPAPGVDVFSVPDQNALTGADDPVDVKGGDGRTDATGRFVVTLAPSGGGELRIGGGAHPTRRVPLPHSPLPLVDLGDIELGVPLVVYVALDRDPGCDLLATGPVGRLGLQIVTGERTGPGLFRVTIAEEGQWQFGLDCGGTIRSLSPVVAITREMNGKQVQLSGAK
jgi:hypothetical protein